MWIERRARKVMNTVWATAIKGSADPARTKHFLELLAATTARTALENVSPEQARILASLFSGSPAMSNLLAANPDWIDILQPEALTYPRRKEGLGSEANRW